MQFKAAIFDMDGLMLDTEPLYRKAAKQAAAELGYAMTDAIHSRLMGRSNADAKQIVQQEFGAEFPPDEFDRKRRTLEAMFQAEAAPKKPGLDPLLDFFDSIGVMKGVATATVRKIAVAQLAAAGLLERFVAVAAGDEVAHGKPSPDLFLLAANRLGIDPAGCLVLEDAEAGVLAAHRAGMPVYLVPDLQQPSAATRELASGVFDSLIALAQFLKRDLSAQVHSS